MKRNLTTKLYFYRCIFEFNLCSNEFLQETVSGHALISGFIRNLRGGEGFKMQSKVRYGCESDEGRMECNVEHPVRYLLSDLGPSLSFL
jgi:hypothetical protein